MAGEAGQRIRKVMAEEAGWWIQNVVLKKEAIEFEMWFLREETDDPECDF